VAPHGPSTIRERERERERERITEAESIGKEIGEGE